MWKLTIYQNKQRKDWVSEEEISFFSDTMSELLCIIHCMAKVEPANDMRYELVKEPQ